MNAMTKVSPAPLAAIFLTDEAATEQLVDIAIAMLKQQGVRVAGFVQRTYPAPVGTDAEVVVEDIETGRIFPIMQPIGAVGGGCRLDTAALADVAGQALARLEHEADFIVLNRFGRSEMEGNGLRAVLEKAIGLDLPVLTSVKAEHVEAWKAYTDGMSVLLPAEAEAICEWCRSVMPAARQSA